MANTNFDITFNLSNGWTDAIAATNAANAANPGYTTIANPTTAPLTIYNKGVEPIFVVISSTQPGSTQPTAGPSVTMGIPVYPADHGGSASSTLTIPTGASGVWMKTNYLQAYVLVQN
jgi:hypothetical protein